MTLLDRLKELKEPSREVDEAIIAICFPAWGKAEPPYYAPHCVGDEPIYWHAPDWLYKQPCPKLTASIDAAVALVEKMLPGAFREMTGPRRYLNIPTPVPAKFRSEIFHDAGSAVAWHDHEPIALLIALLTKLKENKSNG